MKTFLGIATALPGYQDTALEDELLKRGAQANNVAAMKIWAERLTPNEPERASMWDDKRKAMMEQLIETNPLLGLELKLRIGGAPEQWDASAALVSIGDSQAADALVACYELRRQPCRQALWSFGSAAAQAALRLLESRDWSVRMEAIQFLGKHGSQRELPAILARLEDQNALVRLEARKSVDKIAARKNHGGAIP